MRNPKNTTSVEEDQATDTWTASLLAMSLVMCPPTLEACQIPTCGNNSDRFLDFKSMAWIMVIINICDSTKLMRVWYGALSLDGISNSRKVETR